MLLTERAMKKIHRVECVCERHVGNYGGSTCYQTTLEFTSKSSEILGSVSSHSLVKNGWGRVGEKKERSKKVEEVLKEGEIVLGFVIGTNADQKPKSLQLLIAQEPS